MKKGLFFVVLLLFGYTYTVAQEQSSFQPSGKTIMRIFSNFNTEYDNGATRSAFELERAYLGYQYQFTENLSSRVLFDITVPKDANSEFTLHVKNAFVNYQKNNLDITFGMIPTLQVGMQEDFWGYRYLLKSHQDLYKMISTADIGVSAAYSMFDEVIGADLSIINGETYKHVQDDNQFKTAFGLTLKPVKDLTLRAVYDFMGTQNAQTSVITFLGYKLGKHSLGLEYNLQQNVGNQTGKDYWGTSVYFTVAPVKQIEIFGRFDYLTSSTLTGAGENWNAAKDGQLWVAGLEYNPIKGLKITPNYRYHQTAIADAKPVQFFYLNMEVRF
jgi:opacity protein-like surface antigen